MQLSEQKQFAQLIRDVIGFYRQDVSEFAFGIWWEACQKFDLASVSKALTRHAMDPEHGQFPPKVADIVRVLDGTPTDRAQHAWSKALQAIQRAGSWQDVVFDDPAIHAVIEDMGGWIKFCDVKEDELSYQQHRFIQAYQAYAKQESFSYPKRLHGARSPDSVFLERGIPLPKPIVIGNVDQARLVYKGGDKEYKAIKTLNDVISNLLEN